MSEKEQLFNRAKQLMMAVEASGHDQDILEMANAEADEIIESILRLMSEEN